MSDGEPSATGAPLCQRDIDRFGNNLMRCYPVDGFPPFEDLLRRIDKVELASRDAKERP